MAARLQALVFLPCVLAISSACSSATSASSSSATGQSTSKQPGVSRIHYTDTAEGAFSMDVPAGWQIQGGMYRFGYFDVRWMMDARSLDGKTIIRIDDVNIPAYTLPGPNTGRDGQPYTRPQQFQMMVANFREAHSYADRYMKQRFSKVCTSMSPRQSTWTPTMPAEWRLEPGAKATQASLSYDCTTSDGPRVVDLFVQTTQHPQGLWTADPVISIIATAERMPTAQQTVQHMIDSWHENEQWKDYQARVTQMGLAQIRESFNQFMQQIRAFDQQRQAAMNQQVARFEARQNAQAQQVSSWGYILTGVTNVADPQTGTQFQVFSGPHANYYTNGSGVTINSNISPGPGFHQDAVISPR